MQIIPRVPILYHIPRCGGTFTVSHIFSFLRSFRRKSFDLFGGRDKLLSSPFESIKTISCLGPDEKNVYFKFVVSDPDDIVSLGMFSDKITAIQNSKSEFQCSLDSVFDFKILNFFQLLFVVISQNGVGKRDDLKKIISNYQYGEYMCLREPISRLRSEFFYIRSEKSKHEISHGSIVYDDFASYVDSDLFPSDPVVKYFLGEKFLESNLNIEMLHFLQRDLKDVKKFDFNSDGINLLLKNVAFDCFNLDSDNVNYSDVDKKYFTKNDSLYTSEEFPRGITRKALSKNKFDRIFYKINFKNYDYTN